MLAGHLRAELEEPYGTMGQMSQTLLEDAGTAESWTTYATCDGHFPSQESLRQYDVRTHRTAASTES